jgi:hypothetical protein
VSSVPPDCSKLVKKPLAVKLVSEEISLLNFKVKLVRFSHAVYKSTVSLSADW